MLSALALLTLLGSGAHAPEGEHATLPAAKRATDELEQEEFGMVARDFGLALNALRSSEREGEDLLALQARRGGTLEQIVRLLADTLCEQHGRCDVQTLATYYLGLPSAARQAGWEAWLDYADLQARIHHATSAAERWTHEDHAGYRDEVADFVEEARQLADVTPLAYGLSLAARLDAHLVPVADPTADRGAGPDLPSHSVPADLVRRADASARESLVLFERAGLLVPQLEPLVVLGDLERKVFSFDVARAYLEHAAALARERGIADYEQEALQLLLRVARDSGDFGAAERTLRSLARLSRPEESWPVAREHAALLLHADRSLAASEFLARHEPQHPRDVTEWAELRCAALLRRGEVSAARAIFDELCATSDSGYSVLLRARLALAEGRQEDSLAELDAGDRHLRTRQARAQASALRGSIYLESARPSEAVVHLRDALHEAHVWEAATRAERPTSVIGEWIGLSGVLDLAHAHVMLDEPLEALRVVEDAHASRLRSRRPGLRLSTAELREWAGEFELGIVSWSLSADAGLVAHIAPDGTAWAAPLDLGRRSFEEAVRRIRDVVRREDPAALESRAAWLAEISATLFPSGLVERLDELSVGGPLPRLLLLTHGPLESLPFALIDAGDAPLVQRARLLSLPGLPDPGLARKWSTAGGAEASSWMFMGSPRAADGNPMLPAAELELAELAAEYPSSSLLRGAGFSRAACETALDGGSYLHVATHLIESDACPSTGFANVGLVLDGGDVLCAEDIRAAAPNLQLVVLTTCDSVGGSRVDAEGLFGVGRAFLEGGTRNVVVTLWPITDEAGRAFGRAFHRALRAGERPSGALHEARARLRRAGFATADWSAFRLVGRD